MFIRNIAVLIPALNPDHKLIDLIKGLKEIGLVNILVVDDGSDHSTQEVFTKAQFCRAEVIAHKQNLGKGAALKTGIRYIKSNQPNVIGIVTADADGQHTPQDILKVAEELAASDKVVLGTRDLSRAEVPLTSKIGNAFSAIYYKMKTGKALKDTQTGLRGIPAKYFDFALNVEGDRYEYEMRFLEQMSMEDIDYQTVPIETIYEEDRVTHFRTVSDSITIYKSFFKNIASSMLSAILDVTSFMLLAQIGASVFSATVIARLFSGVLNFTLNKVWVFEKKDSHNTRNESIRYLILFVMQMIFSGLLTNVVSDVLDFANGLLLSKILVDCFLFFTNFLVQRHWVFKSNKTRKNKMKYKHTFAYFYSIILTIFTIWSLLDTFVIADKIATVDAYAANTSIYEDLQDTVTSVETEDTILTTSSTDAVSEEMTSDDSTIATSEPIITDYSYQDENIQITIEVLREYDTDIYIADVVISDIAYLKTALADNTFGRNIKDTTSNMAEEHDAILAINGDYYGFRNAGFVLRNGVLYQSTAQSQSSEALVVNADGSFEIVNEASSDAQALYDAGALQIFTFGPGLIEDGVITVSANSEVSQSRTSNPRTAIGMIDELHYIFLVSDGRTSQSAGLSLLELAEVMQDYGCTVAYNLDGGGSSTMVFNGQVINNPTDGRSFGERKVSDIIYIGGSL
ncbi:MAG: phosphodiester glycosidase family protein [Anaerolineaceae bacterium]|nr:phosphodiester glycosidase family protein [Anaerolineaceae bacterium]